jgi:hypothetical protein
MSSIVGSWELVSRLDRTAAGESRVEPSLGSDPIAFLVFDESGHFAVQFMKRDRASSVDMATAGANNSRAQGGYDAYFGAYAFDEASGSLRTWLTAALAPESVGKELVRRARVAADTLTLQLDTTTASGEAVIRTLLWRKVA